MKKKIIIISVILVILVLISTMGLYLYNKNINYKITIIENSFGEFGEQYHNKELRFNIKLNDEFKVNGGLGDELTFKVIKVNKNFITIKASEEMSQKTSDLLTLDDKFIIKNDETTILNRIVTDIGVSYTIKLER